MQKKKFNFFFDFIIFSENFYNIAIIVFLIAKLTRSLAPDARATLVGTAIVIFIYRAIPSPGPGSTWWMIDELRFDGQFLSVLSLISSALTLAGMFLFRRFMAERSITYVIGFLTLTGFLLSLPTLGMFYGLHHWTAAVTGGIVDARFIALVDTALESPLGQIAMIPMLARQNGAKLVIVNREPTEQDRYADLVIHEGIGAVMAKAAPLD